MYKESDNKFLADASICRSKAPELSDKKDTITFEWIDVDLYALFCKGMIL